MMMVLVLVVVVGLGRDRGWAPRLVLLMLVAVHEVLVLVRMGMVGRQFGAGGDHVLLLLLTHTHMVVRMSTPHGDKRGHLLVHLDHANIMHVFRGGWWRQVWVRKHAIWSYWLLLRDLIGGKDC